jgi:hypothetical protein
MAFMSQILKPGTRETRFCSFIRAIDRKARTAELSFSSETPVERSWGVEILDHGKKSVRLGRLRACGPLLVDHDARNIVGVIESVRVDADLTGRAVVRFGKSARAEEVFQDVLDGNRYSSASSQSLSQSKADRRQEVMKIQDMNDEQYGLFFGVCRSIRYHDRRRAFFEQLHRISGGLTVLLAGSVLFDLSRPGQSAVWMTVLATVAALLAAFDIVIGYAAKANLHLDLKRRFCELEMSVVSGGDSEEIWKSHQLARLRIEQDEPPIFRALDCLCHNELMTAQGYRKEDGDGLYVKLNNWQKFTRHFIYWGNLSA